MGIGTVRPKSSSHVFSLLEVRQDSLVFSQNTYNELNVTTIFT
jgi:outer membrane protein W